MRTNVVLDDDLVHEAMRLVGVKTKKEIIAIALQEFVTSRKRKNILERQLRKGAEHRSFAYHH